MYNPAPTISAQWDFIVNTLRTESQVGGKLNGCSWTDVEGTAQTSSMLDVRRSDHLWTQVLDLKTTPDPRAGGVCGVMLQPWSINADYASSRRMLFTNFEIIIAVTSIEQTIGYNKIKANGDDALAQAWSFIEDGNGKGIMEIFRGNFQNAKLGGNANEVYLSKGDAQTLPGVGATPQLWAYVSVTLHAEKPIGS